MINGLLISFFLLSLSMIFFFVHLSFAGNFFTANFGGGCRYIIIVGQESINNNNGLLCRFTLYVNFMYIL